MEQIANHSAVSCSICDRRGADTNLAFQSPAAVHILPVITSRKYIFSPLDSGVPTGCFPEEITIPKADIRVVFSVDQTGRLWNWQVVEEAKPVDCL